MEAFQGLVLSVLPGFMGESILSLDEWCSGLGLPRGFGLMVAQMVALAVTLLLRSAARSYLGVGAAKAKGSSILLLGECGAGKTVLLHRICFGNAPPTVSSMKPRTVEHSFSDEPAAKVFKVVDFPGHGKLRRELDPLIRDAVCIVFLVDASNPSEKALRKSAELLYDILTSHAFDAVNPPLLIAANKGDHPKAASHDDVRKKLEVILDDLKTTRTSLHQTGDDDMEVLHLGSEDRKFTFEEDAPTEFTSCSALKGGDSLESVMLFVEECAAE